MSVAEALTAQLYAVMHARTMVSKHVCTHELSETENVHTLARALARLNQCRVDVCETQADFLNVSSKTKIVLVRTHLLDLFVNQNVNVYVFGFEYNLQHDHTVAATGAEAAE